MKGSSEGTRLSFMPHGIQNYGRIKIIESYRIVSKLYNTVWKDYVSWEMCFRVGLSFVV